MVEIIDMPEDTEKSVLVRLLIEQRATNYLIARLIDYNRYELFLNAAYNYAVNGKAHR